MDQVIALLSTYRYWIIFPLAILEGPILTIILGFLVTLGQFNPFAVYAIIVLGDFCGDLLHYSIGRWGRRWLPLSWIGLTEERLHTGKKYFEKHKWKALISAKLVHGVGASGLIVA